MKITEVTLSKKQSLLEQHINNNKRLVESICRGMTREQKYIVEGINRTFRPLIEASLTPDQIKQIFTNIQSNPGNRTVVGQGKDVLTAANNIINKAGTWLQNTTPVQMADQKFEQLKTQIAQKFPGLDKGLTSFGTYMKENPGKSAFVIGILTTIASLAAGPVGGAIAGQVLRGSAELMKGSKLSTAAGKGLKTAAMGYAAGKAIELIKDLVPPEVATSLIGSDGQTIDPSKLAAMSATDAASLSEEDIKELLQAQRALMTAAKSATEGADQEQLMQAFKEVSEKVNELGGQQSLMQQAGITGRDLQMQTITSTTTGAETTTSTQDAYTITAQELDKVGINFDAEPNISPAVKSWAESKGLDPDKVQQIFQMEKAMDDAAFMGQNISAETALQAWSKQGLPTPEVISTDATGTFEQGQNLSQKISVQLPGLDKPIQFSSSYSVQGVDSAGNPTFKITDVNVMGKSPLDDLKMDEKTFQEFQKYLNQYIGVSSDSLAGVKTDINDFNQKLAQTIGAAASAAAIGLEAKDKKVTENINRNRVNQRIYKLFENIEKQHNRLFEEKNKKDELERLLNLSGLNEGIMDTLKGAAGKALGAAKGVAGQALGAAQKFGTSLTNKVTADQLMKAWQAAGSPTESEKIIEIIKKAGVPDAVMQQVLKDMNIEIPAAVPAAPAQSTQTSGTQQAASATPASSDKIVQSLTTLTSQLKQSDPTKYPELIKTLKEEPEKVSSDKINLPGAPRGVQIMTPQQFVAQSAAGEEPESKEGVAEATTLPADTRELKGQELIDYLDRIRKQEKDKSDKYNYPYMHRGSVVKYYSEEGKKYNTDAIKEALAERPKSLLKKNEKMQHSDGPAEQFFNIGFAALVGIALDEDAKELIIVNTCPGAGSCKVDCFAMKGGKVQFQGPWLSDGRILTYLLNDPEGFFSQLKFQIEREVAKGQKGNYKVSIRWHDAGDFFSPEYTDMAFALADQLPMVDFYAYTKIAKVALRNKPKNFMINWSEGAHTSQEKQVKAQDPNLEKTKNSRIVPSDLFYDLLVKDEKKNLVKGPEGQWQVIPEKLPELKRRLAEKYGLSVASILSYDEWDRKTRGGEAKVPLQYNVIITPGEPDITAKSDSVLSTLLLKH